MNRNQKIAIGCGGAGCLGLLLVAVVAAGVYLYSQQRTTTTNRNANISITSSDDSSNSNSANSSDDTSSTSMSDDDKHKLFQAAGMTHDTELTLKVLRKIGFPSETGSAYEDFVRGHVSWALNNTEFIISTNTPEKARAYVEAHLDD